MDQLLKTTKFWKVVLDKWKRKRCTHNHKFFRRILKEEFKCTEARVSCIINEFESHGGYCDCEVLLNAMERCVGPKKWDKLMDDGS